VTVSDLSRRLSPVALLVAGAFFMENLDGTVIATALPQMAQSFRTTPPALAIGMTAYLLTLAVFIPASGWAADRFGARRVFMAAMALFTFASVLCGLSQGRWEFTAARILQGGGGALMVPVGRLVVLRGTAKPDLMRAIATLTWPALVAPVLGPPVGGFIATYASWRWIFFLNVPLGMAGLGLASFLIRDTGEHERRPFDGRGFALNGLALALLLYAFDLLGHGAPGGGVRALATAAAALGASGAAGVLALRHARRHAHPLVGLGAFAVPSFRATMTGGFVSRVSISTLPFLLPLLFQVGLGMDPFVSGLLVLWYGVTNLGIKPWTSGILRRHGFRGVLLGNTLLNALAIGGCALIGPGTPLPVAGLLLALAGASRSLQFTSLNTLAFAEVPAALTGAANTLFNTAFQAAIGMGIALGAVLLHAAQAAGPAVGLHGPVAPFRTAFLLAAALALVPVPSFLRLRRDAGSAVSGHRPGPPP
jgi:EmrB/QacA subfamily drug resistance transporter